MMVNYETCTKIQCGAISQQEAGFDLLQGCTEAGYAGVRSCIDPICTGIYRPSYCGGSASPVTAMALPAPVPPPVAPPVSNAGFQRGAMDYEALPGLIKCPGEPLVSDFKTGLDTWVLGSDAVFNKAAVLANLQPEEIAGFLSPLVAAIGAFLLLA